MALLCVSLLAHNGDIRITHFKVRFLMLDKLEQFKLSLDAYLHMYLKLCEQQVLQQFIFMISSSFTSYLCINWKMINILKYNDI